MGGPVAAAVAAGMAIAYRLNMGGIEAVAGSASIAATALIVGAAYLLEPRRGPRRFDLPSVAIGVTGAAFLTIFLLPRANWPAALANFAPVTLLDFSCTILFVLSLRRDESHRRLITTNAIYRAIIEALPDSLNAKDATSRFVAANPATARLMGAGTAEDLIGKSDLDFYPAAMAAAFRTEELRVLANAVIGPLDQEVEFPDGSRRWLTSLKTPLLDASGNVWGVITHNRDVTDHKKLEIELETAQSHLQEALTSMADGLVLYDRPAKPSGIRFSTARRASAGDGPGC